jgi:CBS domain-containing protein
MSPDPKTIDAKETVAKVATLMRDEGVGAVVVVDGQRLKGIITDRDIAIRAVADKKDPWTTSVGEIASEQLATLTPDDPVEKAIELMRKRALRRIPVVEGDRAVGILSIGDLALARDPQSALADISAAPANR